MLIAIAGAIGSGKSSIAEAVSRRLDIPVQSIDDDKRAIGAAHPDFDRWVADGTPFPDDFRRRVYARTLDALAVLAKAHRDVIVEETFHRREVRTPFFEAGCRLLGGICLVEIAVTPDIAAAHLQQRARDESDHLAGRAMFDVFAEAADPLDRADLVVRNDGELAVAVDEVCAHLVGL
ncbi:MAG: AAA family ATPase, partial [Ilumatobacteraceae bacterium]